MNAPMCSRIGGFAELAAGLFWADAEKKAMIWGYYDESGEYEKDPITGQQRLARMSIGGCMSTKGKWALLDTDWKLVLDQEGLPFFHMTDFEAWRPPFNFTLPNGKRDQIKHNRILAALLEIMVNHIEGFYGFASSSPISPDPSKAHRLSLEDCVVGAVSHAVNEAWEFYREPINLVFAKQNHFPKSEIEKYIWLYDFGDGKDRIKGFSTCDVKDVRPLQAADLFAYEIAREQRRDQRRRFPFMRLDLAAKAGQIRMTLKWGPIRAGKVEFLGGASGGQPS